MGRDIETRVAVLGAGLQGCAIALELAARGHDVLLLERDARALNRASLRNEGKIHQGLIYAAEASGDTALVQLQGALLFRRLVARWIGAAAWSRVGISTPFTYLVARDSLLAAERLEAHYAFVEAHARQWGGDYLGRPLDTLARRVDAGVFPPPGYAGDGLSCAFATQELALDTEDLAREVRAAIASEPRIRFMPSCDVRQAVATAQGFDLACLHGGEPVSVRARQVVNATWDNRLWLDRQAGAAVREGWLHRLK
jgi:glycerol-3-phosphate dehydrogenase